MSVPNPNADSASGEASSGSATAAEVFEGKAEKKANKKDKKRKKEKGRKRSPFAGRSKKSLVTGGVAGLLVVALIAAAVFLAVERYQAEKYNENRQAYLDAAKQAVLNLTTIHPETAAEDVTRIIEGSTGPFRADFESRKDPFISVIQESQVRTDGEIVAAAVENQSDELATLLVAAKTTVSSVDQPEPSPRNFRMRVTIVDQDGKLKASKVEFVP